MITCGLLKLHYSEQRFLLWTHTECIRVLLASHSLFIQKRRDTDTKIECKKKKSKSLLALYGNYISLFIHYSIQILLSSHSNGHFRRYKINIVSFTSIFELYIRTNIYFQRLIGIKIFGVYIRLFFIGIDKSR